MMVRVILFTKWVTVMAVVMVMMMAVFQWGVQYIYGANIIQTFVLFGRHSDPNELRQRPEKNYLQDTGGDVGADDHKDNLS